MFWKLITPHQSGCQPGQTANEARASDPQSDRNKNSPLNLRENDEKSFWKNAQISEREETLWPPPKNQTSSSSSQPSEKHGRSGRLYCQVPSSCFHRTNILFLRPVFLKKFCPRRLLSFRWIHNVRFHRFYIKKFTDTNGLKDAEFNDTTKHNFQCKQMFCNSSPG